MAKHMLCSSHNQVKLRPLWRNKKFYKAVVALMRGLGVVVMPSGNSLCNPTPKQSTIYTMKPSNNAVWLGLGVNKGLQYFAWKYTKRFHFRFYCSYNESQLKTIFKNNVSLVLSLALPKKTCLGYGKEWGNGRETSLWQGCLLASILWEVTLWRPQRK